MCIDNHIHINQKTEQDAWSYLVVIMQPKTFNIYRLHKGPRPLVLSDLIHKVNQLVIMNN